MFSNTISRDKMTKDSWIYFQIGRPVRTCVVACVLAKILRVYRLLHWCSDSICYRFATYLLIMILRLGNTNTYIHKLCQKMAEFQKGKKSKQIVTTIAETATIAETGILCSVTPWSRIKRRPSVKASLSSQY